MIVEIPQGIMEDSVRRNIPFSPTPISRGKSSILQNTVSEIEEAAISRTPTPTEVSNPMIKRTFSQPEITIALSNPRSSHGNANSSTNGTERPLHRSYSVPDLKESGNTIHIGYVGTLNCAIPSTTQLKYGALARSAAAPSVDMSDKSSKDATEGPVCRICWVELGEGSGTVKMECSCKGELALAHRECAVKWFTLKGNKTCDICRNKVQNIQIGYSHPNVVMNAIAQAGLALYRYWIAVPVDLFCSVAAYFLFVLELLSTKEDHDAKLATPGSIVLGIIAHVISFSMASVRKQAWVYGLVQFSTVVIFGHVLYLMINCSEYTSILVAALLGFSLTMGGTVYLRRQQRRLRQSNQRPSSREARRPNRSSETARAPSRVDLQQTDVERGNSRVDNSSN